MLVIRVNRQGELCNAKPCRECTRLIQKTKSIRFVYYSNNQGEIECVRANQLTSDKIALGTIFRSRGFVHLTPRRSNPSDQLDIDSG